MTTKIKSLRKFTTVLMITMLTGSFAMAQPGGQKGPPEVPSDKQITKMVKDLDKELDLSDEQGTQVSELYLAHFDKVEAKMESSKRPGRQEMETLNSDLETKVNAVLDEDQQKLYTAWLKKQEQKRSSQRAQNGGQRPQGGQQGPPR